MRAADYISQVLVKEGIRHIFSVTGGMAMHLNDAFGHDQGLQVTYQHHEQACAMAAEAYARVNNDMAVCCVTAGPGAVNAMTGVLCAWMESIPMLVISGQVRYGVSVRSTGLNIRTMGIQEYDVTKAAAHMTKYAVMIEKAADVRYELEKAIYLAKEGRRGPVWLDIPLDVQAAQIDPEGLRAFDPAELCGASKTSDHAYDIDDSLIDTIIDKIRHAKRPVLFGGAAVRGSGAYEDFRYLVKLLNIPVTAGASSVDLMPFEDPLYVGISGSVAGRPGNFALQNSDVYFSIGSRQSLSQTGFNYKDWAREAYTILNDLDEEELKKPNLHVSLPVVGDCKILIQKMIKALEAEGISPEAPLFKGRDWLAKCCGYKEKYPVVTEEEKGPMADGRGNIYRFYDVLSDELDKDQTVIVSVGTSRVAGTQAFRVKDGQRFITYSQTASMGYGLPAVVGVSRACQGPSVLVTGEGTRMMNLQELQTIATHKIPGRIFLFKKEGYHSIRQTQSNFFGQPLVGIGPESGDLAFPDPEKIAAAFGLHFTKCSSNDTMAEDVKAALEMPTPLLCEVLVTKAQATMPKASSRRLPDGSMVSAPLEDMSPFLSREELKENMLIPLAEGSLK
ncbi:MAG: thiamine pyrophosphate-binding protein [Lachnospiraceae bacterium]|nr:thiamine pyrophosphate-binding protein [Candidatus Equihabitans merdae]